jgi:fatty acid CoA ligase FadD36
MDLLPSHYEELRDRADAVEVGRNTLSFSELSEAASTVAAKVEGSHVVALEATATMETIVAVVGCLMANVAVVPIPPDAGLAERIHILTDSNASVLLTTPTLEGSPKQLFSQDGSVATGGIQPFIAHTTPDSLSPTNAAVASTMAQMVETIPITIAHRAPSSFHPAKRQPGDPAMILYTSGTTGPSKGVVITWNAIEADLNGIATAWNWTQEDVLVHGLPLFHVHGLILGVIGALWMGSKLVHTLRPTATDYAEAANKGGTLFFGVPTVWSRLTKEPDSARALRKARLLVSGSAALPVTVFEHLKSLTGQAPIERYGMTETLITLSTRADGERRPGWVGMPLPNIEARVVDEEGIPVPADGDSVGSLEVKGPTLMIGYLNQPETTAKAYSKDGWFHTGDAACVDEGSFYRIVGRESTDLIQSGGYRIGAGEVETALLAHPAVVDAAVVGEADDDLGQVVVAYVVANNVTETELERFVATTLAMHKRPRRVVFVDSLPRNAMGKVQKQLLGQS